MKKLALFFLCTALLACVSTQADELEAQTALIADQDYPVYSAPGTVGVPRGADNDAILPAGTEYEVFSIDDEDETSSWFLIRYAIDDEHTRFGYILTDRALKTEMHADWTQWYEYHWPYEPAVLLADTVLTDDPMSGESELLTLSQGQIVYTLATLGDWIYVSSISGDWVRGFVKAESLSFDRVFALMDFETRAGGALAVTPDDRVKLDMSIDPAYPDPFALPAAFLLKDELRDVEIGLAEMDSEERYALDAPLPEGTTSISFIPVGEDGAQGEALFQVEW